DQSYMLYMLGQERLRKLMFPLGELTKLQVRQEAVRLGLSMAGKPDSQEICFVGRGYRAFLARHLPEGIQPGDLVARQGNDAGGHQGLPLYTIGQRHGLNLARPARSYVLELEPDANRVVVGGADDLTRRTVQVSGVVFNVDPPDGPLKARIR